MGKYTLEIYTRPTCGDCQDLKRYLKEHELPFTGNDVEKEPDKEQELINKTGNRIVPTLVFRKKDYSKRKSLYWF
ncbi:glutaredoxin 3 [Atopostipes suicloacalis DSM 15692]|uniref:Glutaredoxin 3 n=1 Tax=Atopostipes suicloacalis DSM 15692 TaxID=1121025 RepID=A0A1M4T5K6_9LACT|nr:glutaredoxin family protein [Atopostipes suicloacalis]SHE39670.1 glutaredoxin 3 [Atopostipes suicloacalis DSM 15692]